MIGVAGRRRARRLFLSAWLGLVLWPAVPTFTHLFGEQVSLRIDRCEPRPRTGHDCYGSWTDADGERHSTSVSHVGPEHVGGTVDARLGPWPFDAHAGSLWAEAPLYAPAVLLAACVPVYLVVRTRFDREVKDAARRLLDAPGHFLVLEVNRGGAVRPGGEEHLRFRPRDPGAPVPEGADRGRFASVRRPGGNIAFVVERRADEILVRDVHSVLDPGGREVGRFARLRRRTWALCLSPECSAVLADAVLAHLFTEGRAA